MPAVVAELAAIKKALIRSPPAPPLKTDEGRLSAPPFSAAAPTELVFFRQAVLGALFSSLLLPAGVSAAPLPAAGPLNVRDFGAVGTGTVDDGPAIQRAIDAAQDSSGAGGAGAGMGRAVYFPSGTYLINKTLTAGSNR